MSHRHSHSSRPRRRPERHVRFSLPLEPAARMTQPSISRVATPRLREQPTFSSSGGRRMSMSDARPHHERLMLAHEALHDMRSFLEAACNFHGDEKRRALTVPSVNALCSLVSLVNALRGGGDAGITRRFEMTLRHAHVDPTKRHPHEQLALPDPHYISVHERNARRGNRLRMRREAEWRLAEFVSRQLQIPIDVLRSLREPQLEQRELDALKERLRRFNVPRPPPGVIRHDAGGTNSVPQSPVERRYTEPRPPGTDPPQYVRRAYAMGPDDELFPEMAELSLPAAVQSAFDASGSSYRRGASLGHSAQSRMPPAHHGRSSPYEGALPSPYVSATTYTPAEAPPTYSAANPPQTPPQNYAPSPFAHGAKYPSSNPSHILAYPGTPPGQPAGYPGATYNHGPAYSAAHTSPGRNYAHAPQQQWLASGMSQPLPPSGHPDYAHGGHPLQTTASPHANPHPTAPQPGGHGGAGHSPYNVPRRY